MPRKYNIPLEFLPFTTGSKEYGTYMESGTKTPNFRFLKSLASQGLAVLPTNSYTFQNFIGNASPGKWYRPPPYDQTYYYYGLFGGSGIFLGDICNGNSAVDPRIPNSKLGYDATASLARRLDNALRAKLNEQDMNVPVIYSELGKTIRSFVDIGKSLLQGMKNLIGQARRHPNPTRAINALITGRDTGYLSQGLASRWLSWSFAIKPTLGDLHTALNRTSQFNNKAKCRGTVSTSDVEMVNFAGQRIVSSAVPYDSKFTHNTRATLRGTAMLAYLVSDPRAYEYSQLGLDDPAQWAWELVPFSFVLDWFVPVGTWLKTIKPIRGLTFEWGWRYIKGQGTVYVTAKEVNYTTSVVRIRLESKFRTALSQFPDPHYSVFEPGHYGGTQITHTLALLTQLTKFKGL